MREDADKLAPGTKFIMRCLPLTAINPDNVETLLQQPRPEDGLIPDSPDDTVFCGAMVLIIV